MNSPDSAFPEATPTQPPTDAGPRLSRRLQDVPALAALAADLLRTPNALATLSDDDLRVVINHMQLVSVPAGQVMMREGDSDNTGYLLLMLAGEAKVQANDATSGTSIDISVMGPGNIIGEMGLLDGAPRSTTCTAISEVQAAGLSRRALQLMLERHPHVAALLMVALAKRMADRLRALGDQLGIYAQLAQDTQQDPRSRF